MEKRSLSLFSFKTSNYSVSENLKKSLLSSEVWMHSRHLVPVLVTFLLIQVASGRILDAVDQETLETADNAMSNITRGDNERCNRFSLHSLPVWSSTIILTVLSLFTIVRFANTFCFGNNGFNGTCYTSVECSALGGTAAGSCAAGFGVCCTGK